MVPQSFYSALCIAQGAEFFSAHFRPIAGRRRQSQRFAAPPFDPFRKEIPHGKTLCRPRNTVRAAKERTGLASVRNLILLGVLLAAGAVLKLFLSSYFTVMKPNFVIAMYCLAILLIRPKLREGAIIGVLAGAICQFFPGTPYINLVSEIFGALAMVLLCRLPLRAGRFDLRPIVCTALSTLVSGFAYVGVMYAAFYAGASIVPTPLAAFLGIIFGTAAINAVIVQVLYLPLRSALGKEARP